MHGATVYHLSNNQGVTAMKKELFDTQGFIAFVEQRIGTDAQNDFVRKTIENIVDIAVSLCGRHDYTCSFISEALPGIEFEDVILFADDKILSRQNRAIKHQKEQEQ